MSQENARELVIKRDNADSPGVFVCVRHPHPILHHVERPDRHHRCRTANSPAEPIVATAKPGRQTITFTGDGLFDSAAIGILVADDAPPAHA